MIAIWIWTVDLLLFVCFRFSLKWKIVRIIFVIGFEISNKKITQRNIKRNEENKNKTEPKNKRISEGIMCFFPLDYLLSCDIFWEHFAFFL